MRAADWVSYPQGFSFYVSDDDQWGKWTAGVGSSFQVPELTTTIEFSAVTKRNFTIQVDGSRSNPFQIAEIEVYLGADRL